MNKDQALQRIAAIEKEAAELRELVNKPDVPTYRDVVNMVRPDFYFTPHGTIGREGGVLNLSCNYAYCTMSTAIREALRAKWLNIAAYINGGWTPDWNNENEVKFYLWIQNVYAKRRQ